MSVHFPRKYTKVQSMTPTQRTPLPRPYYVSYKDTTPNEPAPGWYWCQPAAWQEQDGFAQAVLEQVHGPYLSHTEAMRDIQERT